MYRVLLVDDEPWVIRGLAGGIDWQSLNLEIAAQTTDSAEALSIILDHKVDIVITDIQMPNISGLDLMRYSREQGQDCDFIIFSGYNDFEYAKQAIQYGVFGYLLKPLNVKELTKTLSLLVKNIQSKKYTMREQSERFFLEGQLKVELGQFVGTGKSFCVLTSYLTFADKLLLDKELLDTVNSSYRLGANKYVYLIQSDQESIGNQLIQMLQGEECREKEYLFFGLSDTFYDEADFDTALWRSNVAAYSHFLFPENQINRYTAPNLEKCNLFLKRIQEAVKVRNFEQASQMVEEQMEKYSRENNLTIQDLSYLYNQILFCPERVLEQKKYGEYEALSYDQLPIKYASVSEAAYFLGKVLREAGQDSPSLEDGICYEPFQQILAYINGHFNEELTLAGLSGRFYMNMTYICELFRKYQGTTFSKYLTNLRLEKASRMIRDTRLTLAEIAEAIGYRDYYYFIRQFKRQYGVTPGQFRKEGTFSEDGKV